MLAHTARTRGNGSGFFRFSTVRRLFELLAFSRSGRLVFPSFMSGTSPNGRTFAAVLSLRSGFDLDIAQRFSLFDVSGGLIFSLRCGIMIMSLDK